MAKENKSRYVILGLLAHAPMSGYDIKKKIESSISNFYDISYGQIYPELARLELQGLVVMNQESNESGIVRKVYAITENGRSQLRAWLTKPVEEEKIPYDMLLKLFFGGQISVAENIGRIKSFRTRLTDKLEEFTAYELQLKMLLGKSQDHSYYLLTLAFGRKAYQAYLDWADYAIDYLLVMQKQGGDGHEASAD